MQRTNKEIVDLLRKVVIVYKIEKKDFFRVAAYEKAADAIELMSEKLYDIWKKGSLKTVEGVGPTVLDHIQELFENGTVEFFDRQLAKVPSTVFILTRVPKIGPIKAHKLVMTFNLTDEETVIPELLRLCNEHKIAELPGFGEKSEQVMIESLAQYEAADSMPDRIPYDYAKKVADDLISYMKRAPGVEQVDALGSLRRKAATIGDVDIAVVAESSFAQDIVKHFVSYPKKVSVDNAGDSKASIYLPPHLRIDLRVHPKDAYGALLQYFTGSKAHNIKLREWALQRGYSLNEYGLKDLKHEGKLLTFDTEEKLYNFLGLRYIEPEDRVGNNEIESAVISQD